MKRINVKKTFQFILLIFVYFNMSQCITFKQSSGYHYRPRINRNSGKPYEILGEAKSEASNFVLLWTFPVTALPNLDNAVFKAAGEQQADGLIDVSWYLEEQYWILGKVNILHIKGKAIRYKNK